MFKKKTVIVIGAGAGVDLELPTGAELKHQISQLVDIRFPNGYEQEYGDRLICQSLRQAVQKLGSHDINHHIHACWRIRNAMPQAISIDNFMEAHQEDKELELCGKLAIVRSILQAEQKSKLYVRDSGSINYHALEGTWLNSFMQLLTENCRAENLKERLTFVELIIFNYDRCIEHFIYHALQNYYGIQASQAAELVKSIKIYHPYGTAGNLPWYSEVNQIEFGAEPSPSRLLELANQIKTFSESTEPESSDISEIRHAMAIANIVLFLGFAFHPLNLRLISPNSLPDVASGGVEYFGTAIGISKSSSNVVVSELSDFNRAHHGDINLRNDLNCSQLFSEFWRSLSLS